MYETIEESDVTYLPAHIFGTDDISVQMAVFVVIIGTINYASLFVMNIVGRSARQSYIIALEEIFLAAFGLFLTILGVVVLLLVQTMNLANRVLSVTILVSHTFLGVLYLLAKVKQMRQLADRMHATNAPPRTETNHMRSLRRLGERSHDLESSRNINYPYRVVNPGANIGNDIAIPPNMRLLSSSFGTTPRVPSYADPFGALQTSQSTVSTTTDEVDPLLGPAPSVNVPCVLDIGNKPNPTVQQSPSKESSPEPSMSPIRALHGKPFRVNPTTFRHTTEVDIEPMPSSMVKLKPTPTTRREESIKRDGMKPFRVNPTTFRHTTEVDIEPMPSSMVKLKPTPTTRREESIKRDGEPIPSTSRQASMPFPLVPPPILPASHRISAPAIREKSKELCVSFQNTEPTPSTSREKSKEPMVIFKGIDAEPTTSHEKSKELTGTLKNTESASSTIREKPKATTTFKDKEPARSTNREKAKEPSVSFKTSDDYERYENHKSNTLA